MSKKRFNLVILASYISKLIRFLLTWSKIIVVLVDFSRYYFTPWVKNYTHSNLIGPYLKAEVIIAVTINMTVDN